MNVLFVQKELNPTGGGVQRVSYVLGEGLRGRGYGVWYAFHSPESDTEDIPTKHKYRFDITDSPESLYKTFENIVKSDKIDIVICQNVYSSNALLAFQRLKDILGTKIICCLHSSPDITVNKNSLSCTPLRIYFKELVRSVYFKLTGDKFVSRMCECYRISDKYVLLSERFFPVFEKVTKIYNPSKLIGINNPCSFDTFTPSQEKEKIILVVARMAEQQKRISIILKIWKSLSEKYKEWQLVLVGDGPDLPRYKRYVDVNGLTNTTFVGASSDVLKYYKRASIFCMSSIWEGFPMTLCEAISQKCVPVVIENFAAVHDVVDGTNGIVTPSNNIKAFRDAIEYLIGNPNILLRMQNGCVELSKKFSLNLILDKWCEIFKELSESQDNGL